MGSVEGGKREIVDRLSEKLEMTKQDVTPFVDAVLESISDSLAARGQITISGFGRFEVVDTPARRQNLPGGGWCNVPAKKRVKFRPSPKLEEEMKPKLAECSTKILEDGPRPMIPGNTRTPSSD